MPRVVYFVLWWWGAGRVARPPTPTGQHPSGGWPGRRTHAAETAGEPQTMTTTDAIARAESRVRQLTDELAAAKAELREARGAAAGAKKAPRECTCGCGAMTSGGLFVPGHDAKLRSRLIARIREDAPEGDGAAALAELASYGALAHGIGTWDIGKTRSERERKEQAAKTREEERTAAHARKDADKAARERLTAQSREATNKAAESAADRKRAQIAAAKKAGTVTVPAAK